MLSLFIVRVENKLSQARHQSLPCLLKSLSKKVLCYSSTAPQKEVKQSLIKRNNSSNLQKDQHIIFKEILLEL